MVKTSITAQRLNKDLSQISNKRISLAWKGYGSALFLELGDLHKELAWKKTGKLTTAQKGEWTLSSDGAWKLFRNKELILDAEHAKDSEINKIIKDFTGLIIKSIKFDKKLSIYLSNDDVLEIYKADYGFFDLLLNQKPHISYENNSLHVQYVNL